MATPRIRPEPAAATLSGKTIASKWWLTASLLPAVMAVQGCAGLTHYNSVRGVETADDKRTEVLLMDAKQRAVFPTYTKVGDKEFRSFCAEPSPDALSALAAQWGATVSVQARGEGSINGSFGEAAGSIGLRTASIQILRDITYRQCEAYANGGISRLGLETLQRRFQSTMVALLSIEQLTGAVRAPGLTLSSRGAANDAKQVAELTQQTEDARTAVTRGEAEVSSKQKVASDTSDQAGAVKKAFDADEGGIKAIKDKKKEDQTADEAQKIAEWDKAYPNRSKEVADAQAAATAAKSDLAAAETTLAERRASFDRIDRARLAALASGGSASTDGQVTPVTMPRALDAESVKAVSQAVTDIVRDTLSLGYGREVCTSIIGDQTDPGRAELLAEMAARVAAPNSGKSAAAVTAIQTASQSVLDKCLDLIGADADYHAKLGSHIDAKNDLIKTVSESIKECTKQKICVESTEALRALTSALKIAAEMQVGASPVLLTTPRP